MNDSREKRDIVILNADDLANKVDEFLNLVNDEGCPLQGKGRYLKGMIRNLRSEVDDYRASRINFK